MILPTLLFVRVLLLDARLRLGELTRKSIERLILRIITL